jgi:hypothetical protein
MWIVEAESPKYHLPASYWFRAMEMNPEQVKWRDVQAVATGAVGASSDTISCGLQSFVYSLLRRPGAWQKIAADITQVNPAREWKWKAYFTVVPHSWPCYIRLRKTNA